MRKKLNKKKSPLLDEIEQRRIVEILFVVALLFIILFVKLYIIMIVDSAKYKKKLDNNPKILNRDLEKVLIFIERESEQDKIKILAQLYKSYTTL